MKFPLAIVLLLLPCPCFAEGLVGRWDHAKSESYFIRFCDDGTFRWAVKKTTLEGRYRVLSGRAVELTILLPNGRRRSAEFKYRIVKDGLITYTLFLTVDNEVVVYRRTTQE